MTTDIAIRSIDTIAGEIRALRQQTLACAIEIGRRLTEAKELIPHGSWGDWLKDEVDFSQSTANNLMRLFDGYGSPQNALFGAELKSQALGNLNITNALKLLALPESEREEFVQEHDVENISTRELERLLKEAQKAASEAELRAKDLEQDSTKAISEAQDRANKLNDELSEKTTTVRKLTDQIEELKNRPIDVAVMKVDSDTMGVEIKKATAEIEKATKKSISELEKKLKDAEKEKAVVQDAKSEADRKMQTLLDEIASEKKKTEAAEQQLEILKKGLAMNDPIVTEFKTLFDESQRLLLRLKELTQNAGENKERLVAAYSAMLDKFKVC